MNALLDYPTLSDRQLVELHLDGDRDAFRQIVERYQAMVCALGLCACGNVTRSEDIAQEVFLAVWKQLPELREPEKLRSWIGGIARNMIHQAYRRSQRTPTAQGEPLSAETPATGASPSEQAVRSDEAALMWAALAGIPELYREPMVLFYREAQSLPAVAATLEISEELVRQRLVRGRAMLTERMAKFVEESLERSAPTPAFAGVVMLGLPFGVGPAAVAVTEAAVTGGKAVAGGTMSKVASAAGVAGGVAAKGGLAVKAFSVVALLPALIGGFEEFIKFRGRHDSVADDRERRRAAWAYLIMHAGIGVAVLGLFVAPNWLLSKHSPPGYYGLLGLVIIGAIWTSVFAKRRVDRSVPDELPPPFAQTPEEASSPVFEHRSGKTLFGLPLYHVRLGSRRGWRRPVVKAWIAVSDGRAVGGLFALGMGAVAPVSMGAGAVGIFTLGVFSLGFCAMGLVAAGWLAGGLAAAGGYAAKGICVAAGNLAAGWVALAPHVNDAAVTAFFRDYGLFQFAHQVGRFAVVAGLMGWVMPLAMTGWYLWRTRAAR